MLAAPDQILPRKATPSCTAAHCTWPTPTRRCWQPSDCVPAGALNSAGRAHVAGALLARSRLLYPRRRSSRRAWLQLGAAVESQKPTSELVIGGHAMSRRVDILGVGCPNLISTQVAAAPRRVALRTAWPRPDRAVVLAAAGALAATVPAHHHRGAAPRRGRGLRGAAPPRAARVEPGRRLRAPGWGRRRRGRRRVRELRAAAAHASSLRRHRCGGLGRRIVRCVRAALLRVPRKEEAAALAISSGSYERRHVTAASILRARPGSSLLHCGSRSRRSPRRRAVPLVLAPPGRAAAAATRARRVVSAALAVAADAGALLLRGATGTACSWARGCVGSAGVALFYEELKVGGAFKFVFCINTVIVFS